ncbi:MAG: ATP-dependent DNA helicase RecG [Elusimicrobia bacterium]|nr:ATP-dependent DNA helicase RecG [Elusimicrobiota bacterium]
MQISDPVQYLKGVGPQRAKLLARLGITTIGDLLNHYPREYEDRSIPRAIAHIGDGERVTIKGQVIAVDLIKPAMKINILKVAVRDGTGIVYAVFFRVVNPYSRFDVLGTLKKQLVPGTIAYFSGTAENNPGGKQIRVDEYEPLISDTGEKSVPIHFERIVPLYPLCEGITQKWLRTILFHLVITQKIRHPDFLPNDMRRNNSLLTAEEALEYIHFPQSFIVAEQARRRLAFDEFFLLELALAMVRKSKKNTEKQYRYTVLKKFLSPFKERLGFTFTADQKKVINEIFKDMARPIPLRRLLMGDVGSGKTVVAVAAMLLAVENGYQTTLLAPTEILAGQHYLTIKKLLDGLPVRIALVTSQLSSRKAERTRLHASIAAGEIDIVIGTHAVIDRHVSFKNLSLIVIDEQHRFGVLQRAALQMKTNDPDVLLMTATPIPRTLAMTIYGDMDVSVIEHVPPGRMPIETLHLDSDKAYEIVKREIALKHQAYIVYPLVEESDKTELKAAVSEASLLASSVFHGYRVGLIHGQMKLEEKDTAMRKFRSGEYDILIATTVIEVGIDVPNATVMVIEHADRFGLATLHQLRGRVGRGTEKSYCILRGFPVSDNARRRIKAMLTISSGFRLAEEDLSLRGPGEFFGTAQHGIPALKAGNLIHDIDIIQKARSAAESLSGGDPHLWASSNQPLKIALLSAYSGRLSLLNIG